MRFLLQRRLRENRVSLSSFEGKKEKERLTKRRFRRREDQQFLTRFCTRAKIPMISRMFLPSDSSRPPATHILYTNSTCDSFLMFFFLSLHGGGSPHPSPHHSYVQTVKTAGRELLQAQQFLPFAIQRIACPNNRVLVSSCVACSDETVVDSFQPESLAKHLPIFFSSIVCLIIQKETVKWFFTIIHSITLLTDKRTKNVQTF